MTLRHINRRKNILTNFKCSILLKPVLGGVDGNLQFPLPSMNKLNQTESATFSILPCWDFFRDSYFLYFTIKKVFLYCQPVWTTPLKVLVQLHPNFTGYKNNQYQKKRKKEEKKQE
jgi:hypothetical protein